MAFVHLGLQRACSIPHSSARGITESEAVALWDHTTLTWVHGTTAQHESPAVEVHSSVGSTVHPVIMFYLVLGSPPTRAPYNHSMFKAPPPQPCIDLQHTSTVWIHSNKRAQHESTASHEHSIDPQAVGARLFACGSCAAQPGCQLP